MPSIPLWLVGRHTSSVVAQLQTVNPTTGVLANAGGGLDGATLVSSSGTIAAGTLSILTGLIDGVEVNGQKLTEEISSTTETKTNWVPIAFNTSFTLTEIMRQGANACLLANLWAGGSGAANVSRIVLLTIARGDFKFSFYGLMESYDEEVRRGRNMARMTVTMVDPGQTNASYGAGAR